MTEEQRKAQSWLRRGRHIDREIDELEEIKLRAYEAATKITSSPNGDIVQATKDPHKMDVYSELSEKVDSRIADLIRINTSIIIATEKIRDGRLRQIIIKHYVKNERFERIACDMDYDWRQIMRLHTRALNAVYDVAKDEIEEYANGGTKSF